MNIEYFTLPRIYVDHDLEKGGLVPLRRDQAHYFKTVLRRQDGDQCRLFNGRNGEFLGALSALDKKSGDVHILERIKLQPKQDRSIHLLCPPLKKQRMDILIEKVVELGVTDIHPVLTHRTDVRKMNVDRVNAQILEAAEQCERFTIPRLHNLKALDCVLADWDHTKIIHWCFERAENEPFDLGGVANNRDDFAFLIGPAGGFAPEEVRYLSEHNLCRTVSLGETIFRVETAALVMLAKVL